MRIVESSFASLRGPNWKIIHNWGQWPTTTRHMKEARKPKARRQEDETIRSTDHESEDSRLYGCIRTTNPRHSFSFLLGGTALQLLFAFDPKALPGPGVLVQTVHVVESRCAVGQVQPFPRRFSSEGDQPAGSDFKVTRSQTCKLHVSRPGPCPHANTNVAAG